MSDGESVIELNLSLRNYLRNAELAERAARKTDTALDNMADSASDAARELNAVGKGGINIKIKVSDAELRGAKGDIDALDANPVNVTVRATYTEVTDAEQAIERVDMAAPNVTVRANYTELTAADGKIEEIDAAAPSVTVDASYSELTAADGLVQRIDSTDPKVNIDVDSNGKADILEVRDALSAIKANARIELVVKGANAVRGLFASISGAPLVSTLGELNQAAGRFVSLTNKPATGAIRDIIQGEFSRGVAETPEQVALVAAQLTNANVAAGDLAGAMESVFDYARVSGEPVDAIAMAAQKMLANGLADTIPEAMDLLTTGLQSGANGANDLLATMDEFAPHFAGAGLSGAQSIELINQALLAGAQNGSRAGDVFKEVALILDAQLAEGAGAAVDALNKIDPTGEFGLMDTASLVATGEESGAVLAAGVMDGIAAGLESGAISPVDVDSMLTAIFGTPVEELGSEVFKGIDFGEVVAAQFSDTAMESAVAPLENNLVAAAQELGRVLEFELANKFMLAGKPLQDLLDNAPAKMRELADLIRQGEGIPEALEIVLDAPGLADTIHSFESGFSNAIIGFLDGLAKLIAVIPGANADPLRQTVANLAAGQLSFDLVNSGDADEIRDSVQLAVDRGVSESQVWAALETANLELIDENQLIRAEALLAGFETVAPEIVNTPESRFVTPGFDPQSGEFQQESGWVGPDFITDTAPILEARDAIEDARLGFDDYAISVRKAGDDAAAASVDSIFLNTQLAKSRDVANELKPRTDDVTGAYQDLEDQTIETGQQLSIMTEAGVEGLGGLVTAVETDSPKLLAEWAGWRDMLVSVGDAAFDAYTKATLLFGAAGGGYTPGNTPPVGPSVPLPGMATGGIPSVQVPTMVGEQGHEWASFAAGASILNNQTTDAIIGGLAALLSGGFGAGGSNIYNVNANMTINTQGNAAALGAGDRVGKTMRGFLG